MLLCLFGWVVMQRRSGWEGGVGGREEGREWWVRWSGWEVGRKGVSGWVGVRSGWVRWSGWEVGKEGEVVLGGGTV